MRLYVAGPVTGFDDRNLAEFQRAAALLRRACGCETVIPHDLVPPDAEWGEAMRATLTAMLSCDGVALLPGWMKSRGARLERDVAVAVGIPAKHIVWWEVMHGI